MENIICPLCNDDLGEFEYVDSHNTFVNNSTLNIVIYKTIQVAHDCSVLAPLAQDPA